MIFLILVAQFLYSAANCSLCAYGFWFHYCLFVSLQCSTPSQERGRHWCCALIRINKRIFHFDHKTHFAISCHIKHLFRLKVMLFLTYKTSVHSNGRTRTHTLSLHNEIISHRIWNELQVRQRNKPNDTFTRFAYAAPPPPKWKLLDTYL